MFSKELVGYPKLVLRGGHDAAQEEMRKIKEEEERAKNNGNGFTR